MLCLQKNGKPINGSGILTILRESKDYLQESLNLVLSVARKCPYSLTKSKIGNTISAVMNAIASGGERINEAQMQIGGQVVEG